MTHAKHQFDPRHFDPCADANRPRENGPSTRRRLDDLPPAQQAGILCNDPRFQKFAAMRCGLPDQQFNSSATANYLYEVCGIKSRSELIEDSTLNKRFQALRTEFDAWTGKIATQR